MPEVRGAGKAAHPTPPDPTRADALSRIAAKVSGRRELAGLFDDIIDEAFGLFGVDRAGLWMYDPAADPPLALAAQRGLPQVIVDAVSSLRADARTAGMDALRARRVRVLGRTMRATIPALREVYRSMGVGSICFVPLVYGDEPLGLTAALLGLGVQSVVAPVAPVSDESAAEAMVAYHRALATGRSASEALANTLTRHPAAGAFCLYGTDWRPGTGQIQSAGSRNIAS